MKLLVGTRGYWEKRAAKLPRETGWFVGRTDMRSYLACDGGYVHYAYPPNEGERVQFRGTPTMALRKAVLYAERMNRANKALTETGTKGAAHAE